MKKILLSITTILTCLSATAQNNGTCNTFNNEAGLGEWDPNNKVTYNVANNELTINYTTAGFWGQNEMKWDFPTPIDISGINSPMVNYEISVSNVTINGGSGSGCGSINYILLGITLYDTANAYSTGTASNGYYLNSFASGSNSISAQGILTNKIAGLSIKPASFGDPNCSVSGSSSITATIKIKNLSVGNANCSGTNIQDINTIVNESQIYPNPSNNSSTIYLKLNSTSSIKVMLKDLNGKDISLIANGNYSELKQDINTAELAPGAYLIHYNINGENTQPKMLMVY